jgi:hypothetical protein
LWLEGLPIAIWSSRGLCGQWWGRARPRSDDQTELSEGWETQLRGTLRSPLTEDLKEAYLLYDRWAYPLGTVRAGQLLSLDDRSPLDLRGWLTQRRVVNGRNVTTPWNPQNPDVGRILQLVMFYEAAKGQDYTQQLHAYQRNLDFSDQLNLKRAILLGRTREPATRIVLAGQDLAAQDRTDWTYYRIILPVQEREKSGT